MDTNASFGLYNAYLDVYSSVEEISDLDLINENVSSGRAKRASSTRAPIQPMPTHAEIQQIKKDAKQTERPKAAEPVDNSISAMKARFKAEEEKEKREAEEKTKTILPSRGIRSDEPVLRGRTKKRKSGGLAQAKLNKLRDELRHTGDPVTANRVKKIRAALVSKRKWGRQNEEVKAILHFLINENYCDTLDEAMNMVENISDDGLCYIIENIDQIPQTYDIVLEYLLDECYCDDVQSAEMVIENMSQEWVDEIVEAYVDWRKGKLPSGRTPRQSATRSANTQVAKAKNKIRANQGSLASTLHDPTVKKAKSKENRINAVKGEMDSHTSFGGVVNKLLTPGLGNRSNATPRMAHGEPNTDRHQGARFRRTGKEYGQH